MLIRIWVSARKRRFTYISMGVWEYGSASLEVI
jgi:hypothetical protein